MDTADLTGLLTLSLLDTAAHLTGLLMDTAHLTGLLMDTAHLTGLLALSLMDIVQPNNTEQGQEILPCIGFICYIIHYTDKIYKPPFKMIVHKI